MKWCAACKTCASRPASRSAITSRLTYQADGDVKTAIDQWAPYIQSETLADSLTEGEPQGTVDDGEIDGVKVKLGVVKI